MWMDKKNLLKEISSLPLYNCQAEKELRKTVSFTLATNNMKCLRVTLPKQVDLYDQKFKSMKKVYEKNIRRWKDLLCSQVDKIKLEKMVIIPKAIYKFNAVLIRMPRQFFMDLKRTIHNFIWKKMQDSHNDYEQ